MIYFEEGGWYLPDGEGHLQHWMLTVNQKFNDRLTYQFHKYKMAMRWVRPGRSVAIDIGAHVGLWSWPMSHDFERVIAFEPMPEHRQCYVENMKGRDNYTLHACALGDREDTVRVRTRTPGSSGDTGVDPIAERSSLRASVDTDGVEVPMHTLDSFNLQDVSFLKVDVEGFEVFVMHGGEKTIRRCKPCIIVEQKPETGMVDRYGIGVTDAVKYLESLGAVRRGAIQGDYVLSW